MLGSVAGQGGGDLKSTIPKYIAASNGATSYITILNITGSGYLQHFKGVCGGTARTGYIILTVDGTAIWNGFGFCGSGGWTHYPACIRFKNSLKIEIRISDVNESCTFGGQYSLD